MRNIVLCAVLFSLFIISTFGQSIELMTVLGTGTTQYVSQATDNWYNLNTPADYQMGLKSSGHYFVVASLGRKDVLLIDATNSEVTDIVVQWDSVSSPPAENDRFIQDVVRDSAGRLWILTGRIDTRLYQLSPSGELTGPYLNINDGSYRLSLFMEYNNGNIYILAPGAVYLGVKTTDSTPALTSTAILIVHLPETVSSSFPASALSTTAIPFQYTLLAGFDFDNEDRLYVYGNGYIARFDGSAWESIPVAVDSPYMTVPRINRLAFGPDDKIYVAGQFTSLNSQPLRNFASFTWGANPTFDNLNNAGIIFEIVDLVSDYSDDGTKLNAFYLATQSQVFRYDATARTLTQLANPIPAGTTYGSVYFIASARLKTAADGGSESGSGDSGSEEGHNIAVFDEQAGWFSGYTTYSWGTGGSCKIIESGNLPVKADQKGLVLKVDSNDAAPNDWYGCGYYYYANHNNVFLDFTGVTALKFWIRSTDVVAKVEVQFDASTETPSSVSGTDGQDPKKVPVYVSSTKNKWTQVTIPLDHRTADELSHVYGAFLVTLYGSGTAYIADVEAVRA